MRVSFTSSFVRKKRGEEMQAERTRQTADSWNAWNEVHSVSPSVTNQANQPGKISNPEFGALGFTLKLISFYQKLNGNNRAGSLEVNFVLQKLKIICILKVIKFLDVLILDPAWSLTHNCIFFRASNPLSISVKTTKSLFYQ